mmetsp:Transcript_6340/g.19164  ORF Transcript_6340/g.19164 Transcript_6340/m.19164 type:complete len:494 (+) Transcript_6340:64-1545(+)|eukprot:CAMPEP_0198726320 /NCGR_PEP_ID=MMETSP1475-20131203/3405_1 /TAXON_ID= ORGANISM="Unidentified sp., Strain CCMP1999" /NCGR_SAMPLE_ID=MMETSP1475 /ASSEMBLY_ACC=CAM_ASM_001111 /LENGTH=493 /DNA_ID=CAMNT_0044488227 /DNA_START=66 /DNA_END=1547 /DNA_ORIENTATION=+
MKAPMILAFVALFGLAFAGVEDVMILGKDNFTDTITKSKTVFVKFYAPWCGHCKSMKEDYEKAAEQLKDKAILAEVDATIETDIAEEYEVTGFPTLKLFQDGEMVMDYSGGRDADSLVSFVETSLLPAVQDLTEDSVKTAIEDEKALYTFILPEGTQDFKDAANSDTMDKYKKFEATAKKTRADLAGKAAFGSASASVAKALLEKSKAEVGQVVMKSFGKGDEALWSTLDVDGDLETKIQLAAVPIFDELSRETAQLYISHPCVVLFAEPGNAEHDKYKEVMTEASKKLAGNGKVLFSWIDNKVLGKFREQVGVDKEPGVAIIEFEGLVKYIYDPEDGFTADKVASWVKQYIAGELKPNLKSAPIPETNDEPVKIVVGDTWEELVMNKDKDVLIEQYAPWCGHCKKLEPIYKELAEKLAGVETLTIAKMDATENDAPSAHAAKGYPTILFFPAGSKDEGIPYQGGRTVDDMLKFLQEKATHKFEVSEEDKSEL